MRPQKSIRNYELGITNGKSKDRDLTTEHTEYTEKGIGGLLFLGGNHV